MKQEQVYDVVIVGGGPAGGQCARELAGRGIRTALVEKAGRFSDNNFSSGGALREILDEFDLPPRLAGRFWRNLRLIASNQSCAWGAGTDAGVVLDFPALLDFLAEEARAKGCDHFLGYRFIGLEMKRHSAGVTFQKSHQETIHLETKVLVDASGYARAVLSRLDRRPGKVLEGIGLEYHVRFDGGYTAADELRFFLGKKWMPHGYGWIFPMSSYYKVGVAEYIGEGRHEGSLKPFIENILKNHCGTDRYEILDIHGGRLRYRTGRKAAHRAGRVIGIGDSVSTVNPLGWEGIIHAMRSARAAVPYIRDYLEGRHLAFAAYEKAMRRTYDRKWELSRRFAETVYLRMDDEMIDAGVAGIGTLPFDAVLNILFRYDFRSLYPFIGRALKRNFIKYFMKFRRLFF
jgi:flavin-dependent dehydrogenase